MYTEHGFHACHFPVVNTSSVGQYSYSFQCTFLTQKHLFARIELSTSLYIAIPQLDETRRNQAIRMLRAGDVVNDVAHYVLVFPPNNGDVVNDVAHHVLVSRQTILNLSIQCKTT